MKDLSLVKHHYVSKFIIIHIKEFLVYLIKYICDHVVKRFNMDTSDLVETLMNKGDRLTKDQSPNNDIDRNLLRISNTPLWYEV